VNDVEKYIIKILAGDCLKTQCRVCRKEITGAAFILYDKKVRDHRNRYTGCIYCSESCCDVRIENMDYVILNSTSNETKTEGNSMHIFNMYKVTSDKDGVITKATQLPLVVAASSNKAILAASLRADAKLGAGQSIVASTLNYTEIG